MQETETGAGEGAGGGRLREAGPVKRANDRGELEALKRHWSGGALVLGGGQLPKERRSL